MKLNNTDVEHLKSILSVCSLLGIEGIVITEGMARGAKVSLDAAILTDANLSMSEDLRLGIGRVTELEKRISIFQGPVDIDGKSNDAGDVSMLTLSSGKSKVQFRCTNVNLIKYPKSNEDTPVVAITFNKTEVQQAAKAVKTLGAENIVLQISRAGVAKLECSDSSNDRFEIEAEKEVEFIEEAEGIVQTYLAGLLTSVLEAGCKDKEEITMILGEAGSLTLTVKGHTVLVMSQISGED